MNRYEFENLISDYLEGELSFSKRKEIESYLEENQDAKLLFLKGILLILGFQKITI